jgi:TM2 domain-containing membrane protein YozV
MENQPTEPTPTVTPELTPARPQPEQPVDTGAPQPEQAVAPAVAPMTQDAGSAAALNENPDKNYLVALLLSYFLGGMGIDRFYLGKTGSAIAKLLTLGGVGIWQIVDLFLVAFGKLHAKGDDRQLEGYAKNREWVKVVAIVMIIFNAVVFVGLFLLIVISATANLQH